MSTQNKLQSMQELKDFCLSVFNKLEFEHEYAETVADAILEAHLRGAHNQGLGRLPIYVERIERGLINAKPNVRIDRETEATAVLDGDHGMGHYAASKAMSLAISKAESVGIGAVGVKNSTHFGVAAFYGNLAAKQEKIGIVFTNSTSLIAAPGGAERLVGNNPLSIAVPSKGHAPITLDMACSNVAFSRMQKAVQSGEDIPLGWGTDKDGVETTDPKAVIDMGMLIPAGGYKGYGLAVMIDIITGVLTGSAFGKGVGHLYQDMTNHQKTGHFMIAIDIDHFIKLEVFYDRLEELVKSIKGSRKAPGITELTLPGERADKRRRDGMEMGIQLPKKIIDQLNTLAKKFDLDPLSQ